MLQGCRPKVGIHNVTWLFVRFTYPFCKLHGVGYGRREEDVADGVREEDDGLFPDYTTLCVAHVVDFVENNPSDFTHDFRAAVEH